MVETTPAEDTGADVIKNNPDLGIAQLRFLVAHMELEPSKKKAAQMELINKIKEKEMAPYYRELCAELNIPESNKQYLSKAELEKIEAINQTKIEAFDEVIKDAEENLGESEVKDAWLKKADYLCEIGDKNAAVSALRKTYEKTVGMGNRIDVIFHLIRIGIFFTDHQLVQANLSKVKDLMEEGGDWDRKNRLRAYEGLYRMSVRDFAEASKLFLDAVSTFTSYELMSYQKLIFYCVITSIYSLDRSEIYDKLIKGAEVQEQMHGREEWCSQLKIFLDSYYGCEYDKFFKSLIWLEGEMKYDRLLAPHYAYYVRSLRVKAYAQLLKSYKSLTLKYMADAFGVTEGFIDKELHQFIASGNLHCRIDAVAGVVVNTQLDSKNYQYQTVVKDGDILLNRIQKLSRVINN